MNVEGGLLLDQVGGVIVELEEEDMLDVYFVDGLLICSQ